MALDINDPCILYNKTIQDEIARIRVRYHRIYAIMEDYKRSGGLENEIKIMEEMCRDTFEYLVFLENSIIH